MKIYASRTDDTLHTLRRLAGTGCWILAYIYGTSEHGVMYISGKYYISPESIDDDTCRMRMCSNYAYENWPDAINLLDLNHYKYEYLDCIHICKPVEILTGEEFFSAFNIEEE